MATNLCSCCIPFLSFLSPDAQRSDDMNAEGDGEHAPVDLEGDGEHAPVDLEGMDAEGDGEHAPVDLDELMEDIARLLELIEKRKPTGSKRTWPGGSDLKKLKEILASGVGFASDLKDYVPGLAKEILKGIGYASVATAGLVVVAYSLERFDDVSTNKVDCLHLLKEMSYVASLVKQLKKKGMQNVIEEATTLIVEGAIMCAAQIHSSPWKSLLLASTQKKDLEGTKEKLVSMYRKINVQIGLRVLTAIESKGKSPLSRRYPKNAVGIVEPIKEVLDLLECESEEKAVTVILHGFGGTGKTTLADAVVSKVVGCKYSKVRLFENIDSRPDILSLQKEILQELMEPEEKIPVIKTYEDGQRELGVMLEKVEAFIYIDNVLDGNALKKLLPPDMGTAKKLRLLLTAREENVKKSCPLPFTDPKIYTMKGIPPREAMLILKKEIKEGILDESQFKKIIETCCGIPLMLTLAAPFIGRADNITEAYSTLLESGKWEIKEFKEMRYDFAYDGLPHECRDPLLDICSYFKSWEWDRVEDIVGKKILETFKNRALVSKDANGFASVHDVILTLAFQKSEESEGKNVRRTFTRATELEQFFQKKNTEGIKGIWFNGTTDLPFHISASTLDSMSKSVRVVHLGNLTTIAEDNSSRIFAELVYFKAKITHLPFDVSKSKQLSYLTYKPRDYLRLSEMPSSLTHMEFDGSSHSRAFQICSTDLEQLGNLRILRLNNFKKLKNLPDGLGDHLVNGLQELSLSSCKSIEKLPKSISKFRFLRILKLDFCTSLTELPENLGLLNSLQELDLSHCGVLLNLPPDLGNLTRLVNLNLNYCYRLESIPESISKLKLMGALEMSYCRGLKELPCGFCNLSSITSLSLFGCYMLAKLPDQFGQLRSLTVLDLHDCYDLEKLPDQFGQLASLRVLDLSTCENLEKLPQGFGQLQCLEGLVLCGCSSLRELCNDFHCLSSLQNLDLSNCNSLHNLPEDFHCLPSLQRLKLLCCDKLEGKCMDNLVNMNTLQFLYIQGSEQLVKRWTKIQREGGHQSDSITVISEQGHLSMSDGRREIIEDTVLSEFDRLLKNGKGEPFHISDLPPNTGILVVYDLDPQNVDFPWSLIEETIDDLQINFKIIHISAGFDDLPSKVKDGILVVHLPEDRASKMLESVILTLDAGTRDIAVEIAVRRRRCYLEMLTKMDAGDGKSDKYRASWKFLTESELEEYVVGNCHRYLRLKQRAETSGESNIDLLTELFGPVDKTSHIFQKNSPSEQAPSTCGVDKLEGKAILLEMRPLDLYYDIRLQSLKEMYDVVKKEKLHIEIISIPIMVPKQHQQYSVVMDIYNHFAREVPWLVLQNPWTVMTRVVKFFLAKQAGGERVAKEVGGEGVEVSCERWYPSINLIIDPNGRITAYQSCILSMLDTCEEVKILYKHLESVSYQVRWGAKAWPFNHERIEELRKEEWKQAKSMSPLDFHFNHLESVSDQVKKLTFQGNLICFLTGNHETRTCSIVEDLRDVIPIIHIDNECERFWLTDTIYKNYFCLLEKTTEMEGATLSLSAHESMRFWIRNLHLKEEINGMEESDEQFCDLKSLLHSFKPGVHSAWPKFHYWEKTTSMIFLEENGKKIVATTSDEIMYELFERGRTERAKRWIKIMVNRYKKEGNQTHNEDSNNSDSLAKNMRTVATAVEQENVDLDSLSEYISDLLEVQQLYEFFKFNKDRKNWSRPKAATWPTSKGFSMLKNFLSEGTEANWVKDVISSHPEQDKWKIVTRSILKGIGEAHWAAAGLLMVAEVLERSENVSPYRTDYLFVLEETLRLAQYIKQFNEKPGVWTQTKRAATAWIVKVSMECCIQIDHSKFTTLLYGETDVEAHRNIRYYGEAPILFPYNRLQTNLERMCEALANAIAECLPNEGGSHLEKMYQGLDFLLESESEGEEGEESESGSEEDYVT